MPAPKPRAPGAPTITPAELTAVVVDILGQPTADLAAETEQLEAAHDALHRALQNN